MSKARRVLRKATLRNIISQLEVIQYDINNGDDLIFIEDPNKEVVLLLNNVGYKLERDAERYSTYMLKVDEKLKKQKHIQGTINQLKRILKTIDRGKNIYNDNFTTTRLSKDVRNILEEIGYGVEGEIQTDYDHNRCNFVTKVRYRIYLNG